VAFVSLRTKDAMMGINRKIPDNWRTNPILASKTAKVEDFI